MGNNSKSSNKGTEGGNATHDIPNSEFPDILRRMNEGEFDDWSINTYADDTDNGFDGRALFGNTQGMHSEFEGRTYFSTGLNFRSNTNKTIMHLLLGLHPENLNEIVMDEKNQVFYLRYNSKSLEYPDVINSLSFTGDWENRSFEGLQKSFPWMKTT